MLEDIHAGFQEILAAPGGIDENPAPRYTRSTSRKDVDLNGTFRPALDGNT